MNNFTLFAVIAQSILTLYFMVTHWIPLFPWNDLTKVSFAYERHLNAFMNFIQFFLIYGFAYQINWLMTLGLIFWSLWIYGHIAAWWIPYFYGASKEEMLDYKQTFGRTYKFFKTYGNHPAPDACHTILGLLTCFVLPTVYLAYFFDGHAITLYSTLLGIFMGILVFAFFAFFSSQSSSNAANDE